MLTKSLTWIGDISYAQPQGKGEYPGSKCATFWSVYSYNRFFKKNDSLLVIDSTYIPYFFGLLTRVVVMFTNQLNEDELNDMQEVAREVEFAMAERRKKRAIHKEEQEKTNVANIAEEKRLADVGRKYEARVKHMRLLPASSQERKDVEAKLNKGDPSVLDPESFK